MQLVTQIESLPCWPFATPPLELVQRGCAGLLVYLEDVKRMPFTEPKVESATNIGTRNSTGRYTRSAKLCKTNDQPHERWSPLSPSLRVVWGRWRSTLVGIGGAIGLGGQRRQRAYPVDATLHSEDKKKKAQREELLLGGGTSEGHVDGVVLQHCGTCLSLTAIIFLMIYFLNTKAIRIEPVQMEFALFNNKWSKFFKLADAYFNIYRKLLYMNRNTIIT